jgi:predicted nuclease with TOPRIM domain
MLNERVDPVREKVQDGLGHVSVCLETPCVPGEMDQWAAAVRDALEHAKPFVRDRLATNHRDHYKGIAEQDTEMFRQVAKLKAEDKRLEDALEALHKRAGSLAEKAARLEPDEARLRDDFKELRHDGLEFLIQWQQQEVALRSWLQEAFNRERGVGD